MDTRTGHHATTHTGIDWWAVALEFLPFLALPLVAVTQVPNIPLPIATLIYGLGLATGVGWWRTGRVETAFLIGGARVALLALAMWLPDLELFLAAYLLIPLGSALLLAINDNHSA